jgi:hypothetical protein
MSKPEPNNIAQEIKRIEDSALDRVSSGQTTEALSELEMFENSLRSDPSFNDVRSRIESARRKISGAIDSKQNASQSVVGKEVGAQNNVPKSSQKSSAEVEAPIISAEQHKTIAEIVEIQKEVKKSLEVVLAKTGSKIWDENGNEIVPQKVDEKVEIAAAKVEIVKQKKVEDVVAEVEIARPKKVEDVVAEVEVKKPIKDIVMHVEPQHRDVFDDHVKNVRELYKKMADLGFSVEEKQVKVAKAGSEIADNILSFFSVAMPSGHGNPMDMNKDQFTNALASLLEAKKNPQQHHKHEIYSGVYGCGSSKEQLFDFYKHCKEELAKGSDFAKSPSDKSSFRDRILDSRESAAASSIRG